MNKVTITRQLKGEPGPTRAPLRFTKWEDAQAGFQFYPGDQEGDEWTDLVWRSVDNVVLWYQCVRRYAKAANAPEDPYDAFDGAGQRAFRAATRMDIVSTDMILARDAVIDHLIAHKVIACADPLNPYGQRVEIDPQSKAMKIYDDQDNERVRYSGAVKGLEIIPQTRTWTDLVASYSESSVRTDVSNDWQRLAKVTIPAEGGSARIYADLYASANKSVTESGTVIRALSARVEVEIGVRVVGTQNFCSDIRKLVVESPSSGLDEYGNPIVKNSMEMKNVVFDAYLAPRGAANEVELVARITIKYTGANSQSLSVPAEGVISNITAGAAGTSLSYTEYFANGFIIANASNDYILALWQGSDKGMLWQMQNKGGYGLRLSDQGAQVLIGSTWRTIAYQ